MKILLDYSYAGLDIQEKYFKTIGTLQVVSFLVFLPENESGICFMHLLHPVMSLLQTQCHLVVGHTPSYIASNFEANPIDGS